MDLLDVLDVEADVIRSDTRHLMFAICRRRFVVFRQLDPVAILKSHERKRAPGAGNTCVIALWRRVRFDPVQFDKVEIAAVPRQG